MRIGIIHNVIHSSDREDEEMHDEDMVDTMDEMMPSTVTHVYRYNRDDRVHFDAKKFRYCIRFDKASIKHIFIFRGHRDEEEDEDVDITPNMVMVDEVR